MTPAQRPRSARATPDPRRAERETSREAAAREIEAAVRAALARNGRLRHDRIVPTAGPEGLLTLTGSVATQALRREVQLTCWTVPGVWTLRDDDLVVGH